MRKLFPLLVLVVASTVAFAQSDLLTNPDYNYTLAYPNESIGIGEYGSVKYFIRTVDVSRRVAGETNFIGQVGARNVGVVVPTNYIVLDGMIEVLTGVLPVSSTNALHLQNANDVLAAGTNLTVVGLRDVVPDGTAANAINCTQDRQLVLTTTGSTATTGVFKVWLRALRSQ